MLKLLVQSPDCPDNKILASASKQWPRPYSRLRLLGLSFGLELKLASRDAIADVKRLALGVLSQDQNIVLEVIGLGLALKPQFWPQP